MKSIVWDMSAFDMALKDRIDLNRYIGTTDGIYYRRVRIRISWWRLERAKHFQHLNTLWSQVKNATSCERRYIKTQYVGTHLFILENAIALTCISHPSTNKGNTQGMSHGLFLTLWLYWSSILFNTHTPTHTPIIKSSHLLFWQKTIVRT